MALFQRPSWAWPCSLQSMPCNGNYVDVLAIESGALTLHGQLDLSDERNIPPRIGNNHLGKNEIPIVLNL